MLYSTYPFIVTASDVCGVSRVRAYYVTPRRHHRLQCQEVFSFSLVVISNHRKGPGFIRS